MQGVQRAEVRLCEVPFSGSTTMNEVVSGWLCRYIIPWAHRNGNTRSPRIYTWMCLELFFSVLELFCDMSGNCLPRIWLLLWPT